MLAFSETSSGRTDHPRFCYRNFHRIVFHLFFLTFSEESFGQTDHPRFGYSNFHRIVFHLSAFFIRFTALLLSFTYAIIDLRAILSFIFFLISSSYLQGNCMLFLAYVQLSVAYLPYFFVYLFFFFFFMLSFLSSIILRTFNLYCTVTFSFLDLSDRVMFKNGTGWVPFNYQYGTIMT